MSLRSNVTRLEIEVKQQLLNYCGAQSEADTPYFALHRSYTVEDRERISNTFGVGWGKAHPANHMPRMMDPGARPNYLCY